MAAFGLVVLFVIGALLGLVVGIFVFFVSLVRGARAVHADGVVCRAEIVPRDGVVGPRFAGPALVRLSGAFEDQATKGSDVLGLDIRMQKSASTDPHTGDQDLLLGTFESFHTAQHDREVTNAKDYFGNKYSTVTPWWVSGNGPATLRLRPAKELPADRAKTRMERLDRDIASDDARMVLSMHIDDKATDVAELRLVERLPTDARKLRASMFRTGRALRPVGLRNGIRATVYPMSQFARTLRGG